MLCFVFVIFDARILYDHLKLFLMILSSLISFFSPLVLSSFSFLLIIFFLFSPLLYSLLIS